MKRVHYIKQCLGAQRSNLSLLFGGMGHEIIAINFRKKDSGDTLGENFLVVRTV